MLSAIRKMMKNRVAILQSKRTTYSETWKTADSFAEKEHLHRISCLLGHRDNNFFLGLIKPGDKVVIKPNWVFDQHPLGLEVFSIITHTAMIRAVVDLAFEALQGNGDIVIADAPQCNCNFDNLLRVAQVHCVSEYYWRKHRFEIPIIDLRQMTCSYETAFIKSSDRIRLEGDPEGYVAVDLGADSAFADMPHVDRLYGADYDRQETIRHHRTGCHEYLVSKTILGADVLVSVPKLKVHRKVGVTVNAKGMVGINGNKNWIAHFRIGSPSQGGDEYPEGVSAPAMAQSRLSRFLIDHLLAPQKPGRERLFNLIHATYMRLKPLWEPIRGTKPTFNSGNWHGNDTAWRMAADLARIAIFSDREGLIRKKRQRQFFSVVDGIMAGEKEGPLEPAPKLCGVIIAGDNLLGVDLVAARLMGFDWRKIKFLQWLVTSSPQRIGINNPEKDIKILANVPGWQDLLINPQIPGLAFEPPQGWRGHIEISC
jgi:uncharacterized protein (DUF362 family)